MKEKGLLLILFSFAVLAIQAQNEKEFLNPGKDFRPLRIIHNNLNYKLIDELAYYGYGGLVTNVSYDDYLRSDQNWRIFQELVEYAIEQKGMRIWLYDEKGYPSGTAGGLVLEELPEMEAKGLAVIMKSEKNQRVVSIDHPEGHGQVIFVRAYQKNDSDIILDNMIDLTDYINKNGDLRWKTPKGEWHIFYFVEKPFYEETHATHNWSEKRRYVNIMEKEATDYFINITHKEYYNHLSKYFGTGIEAFFTDEPSLLGTYYTGYSPPNAAPVLDPPNPSFELILTLNWKKKFLTDFKQFRGYNLYPYLPYLVSGESEEARKVRRDYYRTVSDLVEKNYFERLERFSSNTGVASSGHLLLEENLYYHPIFFGNIMSVYNKMHYPGIDLLTSLPEKAKEWGVTSAKFASSIASFYGKKHVMSEVSSAFDQNNAGIEGMIAAVGVQYAYGVDIFNSYYRHDQMSEYENRLFTDYIGRVGYLLSHGKRNPNVAVYYPIESIWEHSYPSITLNPGGFSSEAVAMSDNFKQTAISLVENYIDFDYVGTNEILECKIEGNKMISHTGLKYEILIIPYSTFLPSHLNEKIEQLKESGIKIIFQSNPIIKQSAINQINKFTYNGLINDNIKIVENIEETINLVKMLSPVKVKVKNSNHGILMLHKVSTIKDIYFFVNTGEDQKLSLSFQSSGNVINLWNPHTGQVNPLKVQKQNNKISTNLLLNKWQTAIITIE